MCIRFGFVIGAWVGLLMALLHSQDAKGVPTFVQLSLDGLLVALITALLAAALTSLLARLYFFPVLKLAVLIGTPAGLLLGALGYHLLLPILALIVCGLMGILVALILCRLLCGDSGLAEPGRG